MGPPMPRIAGTPTLATCRCAIVNEKSTFLPICGAHADSGRAIVYESTPVSSLEAKDEAQTTQVHRMPGIDASREFIPLSIAVLTVSDTRDLAEDKSGTTLAE